MLEVKKLTKNYGSFCALDSLDFQAERGKIVGLIGPNGAGKSTTIRMIMNILDIDSGEILLDGSAFTASDSDKIGYLPEERGLYKKEKVIDVMYYLAALKGCSMQDALPKIDYWLERFNLKEWKHKKIDALSKGMAQKIQFITTIVHEPQILFLDEPFSGLDPVSSDELLSIMQELKNAGRIVLFSTHVMEQAERVCDHIIMLDKGKKILDGTVKQIKKEHGSDSYAIRVEGDISFVENLSIVEKCTKKDNDSCIVFPKPGIDVNEFFQTILNEAKNNNLVLQTITRNEPSLHDIFVKRAGKVISETGEAHDAK